MKQLKLYISLVVVGVLSLFLSGCATNKSAKDSDLPWGRPAEWEGRLPGFSSIVPSDDTDEATQDSTVVPVNPENLQLSKALYASLL